VVHIPKVLYHTRIFDNTSHVGAGQTFSVPESSLSAVQAYIAREKLNAKVRYDILNDVCHVDWQLSKALQKITIVIVICDELAVFKPCLLSLVKVTAYNNFDIVIVDNGSIEPETLNFLTIMGYDPRINVMRGESGLNYSRAQNLAVSASMGEFICLLRNNVEIFDPNWLMEMLSIAVREGVGCVGGKLLSPDLTLKHAAENLGLGGYASHFHKLYSNHIAGENCWAQIRQQVNAVSGTCLLVKRSILTEVDGFDDAYTSAYADVDFCLRVSDLGYKNIYTPYAEVISNKIDFISEECILKDASLFDSRWQLSLQNTPFYSPNFTRSDDDLFRYE